MARAFGSVVTVFALSLLTACTTVDLNDPSTTTASAGSPETVLNSKVDALLQEQRSICLEPKYAAMRSKSPCLNSEINFTQLADSSKITDAQRAQVVDAFTRMDKLYNEITTVYQAYGTEQTQRIAQARTWAFEQSLKNRLQLVNRNITWGQYLDQRMKINAEMMRRAQ